MLFLKTKSVPKYNISEDSIDILRLIRSENVGNKTFFNLVNLFGNEKEALERVPELAKSGGKRNIKLYSKEEALLEIEKIYNFGAQIITYKDPKYPKLLLEIDDFPPLLTVFGNLDLLNQNIVGIVGGRAASINGCNYAKKIAEDLGKNGFVISSGLARGIDSFAHKGSIETGTIAVIAGGIDKIYPPENKNLYYEIAKKGIIIAELPFGAAPKAIHFPQRNRIISGLAKSVILIEAGLKSGSLITARFALEQNREIYAVAGHPMDPRSAGCNHLIKQGAKIITSSEDLISDLLNVNFIYSRAKDSKDNLFEANINKIDQDLLEKARKEIISYLSEMPITLEELSHFSGYPLNLINLIILELELAGRLQRHPGGKISILYFC